jgi:hypothetical protein
MKFIIIIIGIIVFNTEVIGVTGACNRFIIDPMAGIP